MTDDNVALDMEAEYEGYYGDIQWHTGNHPTTPNKFYKGSNNTTEIYPATPTYVGIPVEGMQLCKNGRTTHKTCSDVYELDLCLGGHCKIIIMEDFTVAEGDSGGPVYAFTTAYGFVMAYGVVDGQIRDVFTRADYLDNAISGLYIVLN